VQRWRIRFLGREFEARRSRQRSVWLRPTWLANGRSAFRLVPFVPFVPEFEGERVSRRLVFGLQVRHEPIGRNRLALRAYAAATACRH